MEDMGNEAEFTALFLQAVKNILHSYVIFEGTVLSVDTSKFTCDVQVGPSSGDSTQFSDVPLRVLISNQASVIEMPAVGSVVLLSFRDGNLGRPQIIAVQQTDDFLITVNKTVNINNKQMVLNAGGNVVFNEGNNGGMVIVQKNVDRLNKIEKDINNLKQAFTTWTPVPNDGGSALKAAAATWYGQQLVQTQKSDIENTKVQQ